MNPESSTSSSSYVYVFNSSITSPPPGATNNYTGVFGNPFVTLPNYTCSSQNKGQAFSSNFPNWLSTLNGQIDLRGHFVKCLNNSNVFTYETLLPNSQGSNA